MSTNRLEAFSDGVIAILITIMVLELRTPDGDTWSALRPEVPLLLVYALSFVNVGIFWNNHHHMLAATSRTSALILWTNLNLLFWISLIPFVNSWIGENHFAAVPVASYGIVLLAASGAYYALAEAIMHDQGVESLLRRAIGSNTKGKVSALLYASGVPLAFVSRWISIALYVAVALIWFVPDPRVEAALSDAPESASA